MSYAVDIANLKARDCAAADIVIGRYRDHFQRTPLGWCISHIISDRIS